MRFSKLLVVPVAAVGLLLPACGSSGDIDLGCPSLGGESDLNAKPRDEVRDGGNLRLMMSAFPENFNNLNADGNLGETTSMLRWMMPRAFVTDAKGALTIDKNFFTDVQLTSTDPQIVTYTLNPAAVWSDGSPITWEDVKSQAESLSGVNPDFKIAGKDGFDRVEKIERGVDDKQVVFTFSRPYAEWQGQFAGPLYPKSVTADPAAFNDSLRDNIPVTAGPFKITSIDKAQNRITLGRNPLWWGDAPKLDTVTYSVLDDAARVQGLQNNEIDAVGLGTIEDVKVVYDNEGISIRCAPGLSFSHVTFNGAEGSLLADPKLRVAVAKGIDRKEIADAILNQLVDDPQPLNNHIYLNGQLGYQDNSGVVAYDPDQANKELDELGWKLEGDVRVKDGRRLELRNVMYKSQSWDQISAIMLDNLQQIGVKLIVEPTAGQGLFKDVINPGRFDLANFAWAGNAFPLAGLPQIYALKPEVEGNYGRIGSDEINALIEQTISELDQEKSREMANQIDKLVFAEGFSLPLLQSTGIVGVRSNLANYGAAGLASLDYTSIGFEK